MKNCADWYRFTSDESEFWVRYEINELSDPVIDVELTDLINVWRASEHTMSDVQLRFNELNSHVKFSTDESWSGFVNTLKAALGYLLGNPSSKFSSVTSQPMYTKPLSSQNPMSLSLTMHLAKASGHHFKWLFSFEPMGSALEQSKHLRSNFILPLLSLSRVEKVPSQMNNQHSILAKHNFDEVFPVTNASEADGLVEQPKTVGVSERDERFLDKRRRDKNILQYSVQVNTRSSKKTNTFV